MNPAKNEISANFFIFTKIDFFLEMKPVKLKYQRIISFLLKLNVF